MFGMAQTEQPALFNRDFPVSEEVSSSIGHQRSPPTPFVSVVRFALGVLTVGLDGLRSRIRNGHAAPLCQ